MSGMRSVKSRFGAWSKKERQAMVDAGLIEPQPPNHHSMGNKLTTGGGHGRYGKAAAALAAMAEARPLKPPGRR